MSDNTHFVEKQKQIIEEGQAKGGAAKWLAYLKLSGPGFLQSAITLGGGSLSTAARA